MNIVKKITTSLMLFCVTISFAQITGTITDDVGPVSNAEVKINSSDDSALTNENGEFSIQGKVGDELIIINPITLGEKTVKVTSLDMGEISLSTVVDLEVIVAYGKQKRVNLTGTVNTISGDDLVGKSASSLAQAMQGVTPGVTVLARPGDVGGSIGNIQIRGRGNLGSSSPLFIIDGVPVSSGEFQRLQPNDIESMSILKDAAASAIYGARAAFGVILVTTKSGKDGRATVSYNTYYGVQNPTILPDFVSALDYANLYNEAQVNSGKNKFYTDEQIQIIKNKNQPDLFPDNNWYDLLYQDNAPIYEHNISISGGGKTRYFVSGTIFGQESLIPDKNIERYSFRAKTERDFTDNFTLGTNFNLSREDFERKGNFSITDLDRMSPMTVAKHSDGSWGTVTGGQENATLAENNPLRKLAEAGRGKKTQSRLNASVNATWTPFENFDLNGQFSYRKYNDRTNTFLNTMPKLIGFISKNPLDGTENSVNELNEDWSNSTSIMSNLYANYTKTIGIHDFSLMAGLQYEDYDAQYIGAMRKDFPSDDLDIINAGSSNAEKKDNEGYTEARVFMSEFGRFNYAYDSKYLFEANIRFDESSQFPEDNRLGIFPSFSAAWRITQESFMEKVDWLNELKLRGSWGKMGNVDNVGYYDYYDQLGIGGAYVVGGSYVDGVWPARQRSPELSWEEVVQTNIGLDAILFSNSLSIQLDVFNKKTEDILLKLPQPDELGLENNDRVSTNAGVVSNKGIEAIVNYRKTIGEVNLSIGGNLTKIWNEVEDLAGLGEIPSGVFIYREGEAIGSFYGYKAIGLFVDEDDVKNSPTQDGKTSPGDIKYADINNDGKISADDRTILGNDVPYFTYGMNLGVNYKGFDFTVQGQGVDGVSVYLSGEASQAFFNGAGAKSYVKGRWTEDNPNANAPYPRLLTTQANSHNRKNSSFWLFDADYFRIKNIILGYTIPVEMTEKFGIQRFRLYASANNYFTFMFDDRLTDFDPEMASSRGTYPNIKTLSFGLNISF